MLRHVEAIDYFAFGARENDDLPIGVQLEVGVEGRSDSSQLRQEAHVVAVVGSVEYRDGQQ
ncbi:MAG: hypothetical protein MK138_10740, partial [Planctomycetes bacterium]|nr:hypothetical protein [Planctomycetota bacterium]